VVSIKFTIIVIRVGTLEGHRNIEQKQAATDQYWVVANRREKFHVIFF